MKCAASPVSETSGLTRRIIWSERVCERECVRERESESESARERERGLTRRMICAQHIISEKAL